MTSINCPDCGEVISGSEIISGSVKMCPNCGSDIYSLVYQAGLNFNAYNHATEICEVMLISYFGLQSKYPEMPKEELYLNALLLRPTIDSETAKYILEERKERLIDPNKLKFWMVVLKMIEYEFAENNDISALGPQKRREFNKQFKKAVTANIPTDI